MEEKLIEERMQEWWREIGKEYKIDREKLEKLDKEVFICRQKLYLWDSYMDYLEGIKDTSYDIETASKWCEVEKQKLVGELKRARAERAKWDLYDTLRLFLKRYASYRNIMT